MKIGVFTDLRFTALATPTGVTKHIIHMTNGLAEMENVELIILAAKDQLGASGNIPANNALSHFKVRALPYSWHKIYWLGLFFNFPVYDEYTKDLDWVYCPKNDYIPLKKTKSAFTFHGAHEIDPAFQKNNSIRGLFERIRSRIVYSRMVKQGTIILTVSNFLKSQIIAWFSADPVKVKVVGNGVEEIFFDETLRSTLFNDQKPFLLSVGGLNHLDGGDRIIELAKIMNERLPDIKIIVAGNQHEPDLHALATKLANIVLAGYLKKEELASAMRNAKALLFLTRYETFGIAAVEAMAVGLPVITVRSTAVPEIVGDSGIYVNEKKIEETVTAIESLLMDQNIYNRCQNNGKQRALQYSWKACVERLNAALNLS